MGAFGHEAFVQLVGIDVALRGAQRVGLSFAASLGERLREVREQHREPQNRRYGEDESGMRIGDAEQRQREQAERQDSRNIHHEHDRVLRLLARRELRERVDHGALGQRAHRRLAPGALATLRACAHRSFVHCSSRHLSFARLPRAPSSAVRPRDPAQARGTS